MAKEEQFKSIFEVDSGVDLNADQTWYQENLDIVLPLIIIIAGLFQFVLRKWILPVSEDVISKLEDQLPSQGLIYNPVFGVFLVGLGLVLLFLFNVGEFV